MNELVSILLPVYNAENYIEEAIDSLLKQTYQNIEIIIVDDCSNDGTVEKIKKYSDLRIKYYRNEKNSGIVYSLNKALDISNGVFLARMDADDICMPDRIEKQLEYIKENPGNVLVSCWFEMFGSINATIKYPQKHKKILTYCLIGNPMLHPGYLMHKQKIMENSLRYDEKMKYAEDLDFVIKAANIGQVANVPKVLMKYRTHSMQTSSMYNERQFELGMLLRKNLLSNIDVHLNDDEIRLFQKICLEEYEGLEGEDVFNGAQIFKDIICKNNSKNFFEKRYLRKILCPRMQFFNIYAMKNNFIDREQALKISLQLSILAYSPKFTLQYIKHTLL